MRPLAALLALCCVLPGASACGRDATRVARPVRPGDTWVLLVREPTPEGMRERRETWTVAEVQSDHARFDVASGRGHASSRWLPIRPSAFRAPPGGARRGAKLVDVRVPAGRFRCERRTRTFTEREGRVMQVDEWWAADVPVPVQAWERWVAHASGVQRDPPRRAAAQALGTRWIVLERRPPR